MASTRGMWASPWRCSGTTAAGAARASSAIPAAAKGPARTAAGPSRRAYAVAGIATPSFSAAILAPSTRFAIFWKATSRA